MLPFVLNYGDLIALRATVVHSDGENGDSVTQISILGENGLTVSGFGKTRADSQRDALRVLAANPQYGFTTEQIRSILFDLPV